jgi:hypothetical protein
MVDKKKRVGRERKDRNWFLPAFAQPSWYICPYYEKEIEKL